jgi:hypothetical protein
MHMIAYMLVMVEAAAPHSAGTCYCSLLPAAVPLTAAGQVELRRWVLPCCQQRVGGQGGLAGVSMVATRPRLPAAVQQQDTLSAT